MQRLYQKYCACSSPQEKGQQSQPLKDKRKVEVQQCTCDSHAASVKSAKGSVLVNIGRCQNTLNKAVFFNFFSKSAAKGSDIKLAYFTFHFIIRDWLNLYLNNE